MPASWWQNLIERHCPLTRIRQPTLTRRPADPPAMVGGRRLLEAAAGEQHEERCPHRPDVRPGVDLRDLAPRLLGRHVPERPEGEAGLSVAAPRDEVVAQAGDAEVEDLDVAGLGLEQVVGLEIAVHDALVVRGGEHVEDLLGDGQLEVREVDERRHRLGLLADAHRVVAELHHRLRGLRLARTGAVFDALVPAVLAQRVTSVEARGATLRLGALLGDPAPGPGGLRLPPSPQRIAALPSWEYHRLGVERQRADTLRRAARVAGRLEETTAMPRQAAMDRLRAVPGIGVWTAASVAMVAFGDADAVPVGDYNLPHVVSWALAGEPRGSDDRMLELLEPYRGHRARVIRLLLAGGVRQPRYGPRLPLRSIAAI